MFFAIHSQKKPILVIIFALLLGLGVFVYFYNQEESADSIPQKITNFDECVEAGNPIMESYPEQCRTEDGEHFVRDIGNELEKSDLVRISSPRPGSAVESPLTIEGEARGYWYFEATFPVVVTDWNGQIIGEGYVEALDEWMTEEFVPFQGEITFNISQIQGNYSERGTLILQKSNASGLPEHDDVLEIPIEFAEF
ncbi:MAG: Gmad2 immunoglobulin-like domain-containing protein [Candidatus Paceibacterota bacterium]